MKINVTEQTTTFPCPVNKLKGQLLMDNMGMEWETEHGMFTYHNIENSFLDNERNVKTSMYNNNRSVMCIIKLLLNGL